MRFWLFAVAFCFIFLSRSYSQQLFSLELVPSGLTNVPTVHSGVLGSYDNSWYFIGGRTNGLHGFQPPFAFPGNGINSEITFYNPVDDTKSTVDIYTLPDSIREPLTSSNMQFYQSDSMLYIVGGYGWKDDIQNFVTWPTLTAVNLSGLKNAVQANQSITPFFRQFTDSVLAVCGAHLQRLDSTYYLVFGHRFDGYYDRSDTTGFHVQEYTHEIRKFQIYDDGDSLSIYNYRAVHDTANFRRRDYNLVPMSDPYRGEALLAFSGVFQKNIDLPYLNCIEIYPDTFIVRNDFNQNLNQYHCGMSLLFDSINFLQHNIFYGGISMYQIDTTTGQTVTDSLMPFVQTVSDVVRTIDLTYVELNSGIRMPTMQGTNAYFFTDFDVPIFKGHYIHINKLPSAIRIGYLTSGIESPEANISLTDPSLSYAGTQVYEVWFHRQTVGLGYTVEDDVLNFICFPNPANKSFEVKFDLITNREIQLRLVDIQGKVVSRVCDKMLEKGSHRFEIDLNNLSSGIYQCVISSGRQRKSMQLKVQH